jgi:pimeloyl-ACP methyl ester carboxylesterase
MLPRKFLYVVAGFTVLVLAGAFALTIFSTELTRLALVPRVDFEPQLPLRSADYNRSEMWLARPGMGPDDPTQFSPRLASGTALAAARAGADDAQAAIFFVHPTSYTENTRWNAPLIDPATDERTRPFLQGLASPFAEAGDIWAPRYRQATVGAFLDDSADAERAIDLAYADVAAAFDRFVEIADPSAPLVLVGHSQGALHLLNLLHELGDRKEVVDRIAVAYLIGWPISVTRDLPELPLPACRSPRQAGCIVSYSTFAEPADPSQLLEAYRSSRALDGRLRGDSAILCSNPLTGRVGGSAPAQANLGTLVPDEELGTGELVASAVPARCDERGLLLIGDPPALGSYVLPGNNYHVYDIPLFWANLRRDAANRIEAFGPVS